MDHTPSVHFFENTPFALQVPACKRCNSTLGPSEQVVAFLSRIDPKREVTEYSKKLISDFISANPRLAQSVIPRRSQIKKALKNYGADAIFNLRDPELQAHIQAVGAKWAYALHYTKIGRPLPLTGAIWVKWWSNANRLDGPILPPSFETILPREAHALRQGKLTSIGQFEYNSIKVLEKDVVVTFLVCGFSFAMVMISSPDSSFFSPAESVGSVIHRPGHPHDIPKPLYPGPLALKVIMRTESVAA